MQVSTYILRGQLGAPHIPELVALRAAQCARDSNASPTPSNTTAKKKSKKRREEPFNDIPSPSDETVPVPLVEEPRKTKKHRRRTDEETPLVSFSEAPVPPVESNSDEKLESAPTGVKKKKRGANDDTRPEMMLSATDESVDKDRKARRKAKQQTSQDARAVTIDAPKEKRKLKKAAEFQHLAVHLALIDQHEKIEV